MITICGTVKSPVYEETRSIQVDMTMRTMESIPISSISSGYRLLLGEVNNTVGAVTGTVAHEMRLRRKLDISELIKHTKASNKTI